MIDVVNISIKFALRWIPQVFTDDNSALVQVMAWWLIVTDGIFSNFFEWKV